MSRRYWLDVYPIEIWERLISIQSSFTGFRKSQWNESKKVHLHDYLICYASGDSSFVGILEVSSNRYYHDEPAEWTELEIPVRFKIKRICCLHKEKSISIHLLRDKLSMFRNLQSPNYWGGLFMRSLREIHSEDAKIIIQLVCNMSKEEVC